MTEETIKGPSAPQEVIYLKLEKEVDKENHVLLHYLPHENTFRIELIVNKWNKRDIKKKLREAIASSAMARKYKELVEKGRITKELRPKIQLEVRGKYAEKGREVAYQYLKDLFSKPAEKIFRPPSNWGKKVGITLGVLLGGIGVAGLIRSVQAHSYQEGYQAGHEAATTQLSSVIDQLSQAVSNALSYLDPARDYLDQVSENLTGIKQSSLSIKEIAEDQISKIQQELQRLTDGYDFVWLDNSTTKVSADYDKDGQVDAWKDENGEWHYDEDSGNPAIEVHQHYVEGNTYYEYVNLARAFEQACLSYKAFQDTLAAWEKVKTLAEGIENDATVSADLIAQTKTAVENAYNELQNVQQTVYINNFVGSSTGIKRKTKEVIARVNWFLKRHPYVATGIKIGALIPVAYIAPAVYSAYWLARVGITTFRGVRMNRKWKKQYRDVLSLESVAELA